MYLDRLKRNIPLYYTTTFFAHLLFVIPIWVSYERGFLSFTEMSIMASVRLLLTAVLELPTGAFADLVGRRISVVIGFFIEAIGNIFIAFAWTKWVFWVAVITMATASALRSGADSALVYDSLKEQGKEKDFSRVLANNTLIVQFGIIISSVVAGYLFEIWNGLPYFLYGIALLISFSIGLLFQEPKIDTEIFTVQNYLRQTKLGINQTLKSSYLKMFSLFYLLIGGVTWSLQTYFNQIFASDIGFSEIEKSWLFASIRFISVIVIVKILKVDRIVKPKYSFLIFPVILSIALLPGFIVGKIVGIGVVFFTTMSSTLRFIVLDKLANDEFESKYRATAMSALNLYMSLSFFIIVVLSGPILDLYSSQIYYSLLGIVVLTIALPLGLKLRALSDNE
ncbi:MFS transporter [Candidatus Dojkabacteria bacterium]|uniref:MFS transporter n=1 Tax=Candidatus Dojkabacteria bacterium TaxID=2099670 RepID=A0A955RK99_9BACT|nr:MFS transporter [Candidatus Dojkabacteria bacterium]